MNIRAFLCGCAENDIIAMSEFSAINASEASHGLIDLQICISQQRNSSRGSRPFNVSSIAASAYAEPAVYGRGAALPNFRQASDRDGAAVITTASNALAMEVFPFSR